MQVNEALIDVFSNPIKVDYKYLDDPEIMKVLGHPGVSKVSPTRTCTTSSRLLCPPMNSAA
jgi:hypothetical protein